MSTAHLALHQVQIYYRGKLGELAIQSYKVQFQAAIYMSVAQQACYPFEVGESLY